MHLRVIQGAARAAEAAVTAIRPIHRRAEEPRQHRQGLIHAGGAPLSSLAAAIAGGHRDVAATGDAVAEVKAGLAPREAAATGATPAARYPRVYAPPERPQGAAGPYRHDRPVAVGPRRLATPGGPHVCVIAADLGPRPSTRQMDGGTRGAARQAVGAGAAKPVRPPCVALLDLAQGGKAAADGDADVVRPSQVPLRTGRSLSAQDSADPTAPRTACAVLRPATLATAPLR